MSMASSAVTPPWSDMPMISLAATSRVIRRPLTLFSSTPLRARPASARASAKSSHPTAIMLPRGLSLSVCPLRPTLWTRLATLPGALYWTTFLILPTSIPTSSVLVQTTAFIKPSFRFLSASSLISAETLEWWT
ncbi:hypothetical protein D1872_278360 [compost metagenome]